MAIAAKKKTALLAVAALALALAASAGAEKGISPNGVVITTGGNILPSKLPRHNPAPVQVLMEASISTTNHTVPPELKQIVLDINSHGILKTDGLPTCSLTRLETVSAATAKHACGPALLGHGNVSSRISLPGQSPFASNGLLLAFNARLNGHPAILAQVTSTTPLALTYVIRFQVKHTHGTYGTDLIGTVPPIASGYGEITGIDLSLKRLYTRAGQQKSVVSASCPAPKGFPSVSFQFAKTSFGFVEGTHVEIKMTRRCFVRG